MLIGSVFEKTQAEAAWELCANKLADWVRNTWLQNTGRGISQWEAAEIEDPAAIPGLREPARREFNRAEFCKAFARWKELYPTR